MYAYSWCVLLVVHMVLSQSAEDEKRPYKFGFNIQGHQHRQEEKDEKGIIKGEYGFITADGYYRVTVYATDENGDFKIISMKNYYVGFPPEDPTTTPESPSQSNQQLKPKLLLQKESPAIIKTDHPTTTTPAAVVSSTTAKRPVSIQGQVGCSHCFIPTTTKKTPEYASTPSSALNRNPTSSTHNPSLIHDKQERNQLVDKKNTLSRKQNTNDISSQQKKLTPQENPTIPVNNDNPKTLNEIDFENRNTLPGSDNEKANLRPSVYKITTDDADRKIQNQTSHENGIQDGEPKVITTEQQSPGKSDANNQQVHDPSGKNEAPLIGEMRNGLPDGVTVDDVKKLLYTFNYTVGFHGHHEDGYTNGNKQGDYFVDGRDGVERKVEYIANEFGYQPNITLIDLDENDVRRPKEDNEKDYGLKGYEFKWFYRK